MDMSNGYSNGIGLQWRSFVSNVRDGYGTYDWLIDFVILGGSEWKEEGTAKDQDI